jgi:hypothetical protein
VYKIAHATGYDVRYDPGPAIDTGCLGPRFSTLLWFGNGRYVVVRQDNMSI